MRARFRNASRKLHAGLRGFFDARPLANAPPLELLQAALDDLERKTEPSGRGTRVFPYSRVVVRIARPETERPAVEAVFAQLERRLRERLQELRCEPPGALDVRVVFTGPGQPEEPPVRVDCSTGAYGTAAGPSGTIPELRLLVVKGRCEQASYAFSGGAVAVGRGVEPSDALGRVRRNDVAFVETRDGVSETVARAHARLQFEPSSRAYVVFNESSSNPTFLWRGGRSLHLVPRDPRGVRVQSGDELQLGRAVIRLEVCPGGDADGAPN